LLAFVAKEQGKNDSAVGADIVKFWSGADVLEDIANSATGDHIKRIEKRVESQKKKLEDD